jgi:DNA-binding NtrC family response regulator
MTADTHRQRRVALVDSDALQRGCTGNSLRSAGIDHASFEHLYGLINAARDGRNFDAILLGLHADATQEMALISDVWGAFGRRVPVFFLAHPTELRGAHEALSWPITGGPHPDVILSPAGDTDLRTMFS